MPGWMGWQKYCFSKNDIDVLAIVHLSVKESYLIIINGTPEYISRDRVKVID